MLTHAAPPQYSQEAKSIVVGDFYEHYKGPHYKVISTARHSETLEEMVVYEDVKGEIWVRPLMMFIEQVTIDGNLKPPIPTS